MISINNNNNNNNNNNLYGGIEAGGTTFILSIAKGDATNIINRQVIDTTTPNETLRKCFSYFKDNNVKSLGIACFGPIDVNPNSSTYGYITSTPKLKWKNYNVLNDFKLLNIPINWNTDVQAAALGELIHGGHGLISSCCYITVGTGVGVGIISNKHLLRGVSHPEAGHIRVPRHPDDMLYKGNCPYHNDCLEGLTNAQSIADRLKISTTKLDEIDDNHEIWNIIAYYLAQLCTNLILIVSPEVIVLGGGVLRRKILFPKIRTYVKQLVNDYVEVNKVSIVSSKFNNEQGDNAGTVGAIELAIQALHSNTTLDKSKNEKKSRKLRKIVCSVHRLYNHRFNQPCDDICNCSSCKNDNADVRRCTIRKCATCCKCENKTIVNTEGLIVVPNLDHSQVIMCPNTNCNGSKENCSEFNPNWIVNRDKPKFLRYVNK